MKRNFTDRFIYLCRKKIDYRCDLMKKMKLKKEKWLEKRNFFRNQMKITDEKITKSWQISFDTTDMGLIFFSLLFWASTTMADV